MPMSQNPFVPPSLEKALGRYEYGMRIMLEGARAETGQTPKEVVWSKNKAKLYHYEPMARKQHRVPLLMIYALINRPYVLDLMPGNSYVEFMARMGYDVYLLDWGVPGDEDSELSYEHYILDYIPRAVKKVQLISHSDEFSLLGYCMGGTMTAMYAALHPNAPLRNMVLLTAPFDFSPEHIGLYGQWTAPDRFNPTRMAEAFGNIPGELIDTGNRMLKPVTNYVGTYVNLWDRVLQDKSMDNWLAMNKWVNDGVPFPGAAFRQWIGEFYQENKLLKGQIVLRGRAVDLSKITCSLLTIAGKKDHICPIPQAEAIMRVVNSTDKEFLAVEAGHVGLMTGSDAKKVLWPKMHNWLAPRSE